MKVLLKEGETLEIGTMGLDGSENDGNVVVAHRMGSFSVHSDWADNEGREGVVYHVHDAVNADVDGIVDQDEFEAERLADARLENATTRALQMLEQSAPVVNAHVNDRLVTISGGEYYLPVVYNEIGESGMPRVMIVHVSFTSDRSTINSIRILAANESWQQVRAVRADMIANDFAIVGKEDDILNINVHEWLNAADAPIHSCDFEVTFTDRTQAKYRLFVAFSETSRLTTVEDVYALSYDNNNDTPTTIKISF